MYYPDLEEVKKIAEQGKYDIIPVSCELYADGITPIEVLRILKSVSKHCYLLESVEDLQKWGRYTFLGYEPTMQITCSNHQLQVKENGVMKQQRQVEHPQKIIREILQTNRSPRIENLPTFTGGLVGYFSYDYIKYSEPKLNLDAEDEEGFKDVDLMMFDKVIAFDNFKQKIVLIANCRITEIEKNYEEAKIKLQEMAKLIKETRPKSERPFIQKTDIKALFSKEQYCQMVEKAKQYIKEGDIFQVVLSNRLEAEMEGSLLDVYRVLRTTNPSPYMFYFSGEDGEIAGASPETLVKLENSTLHTFPLAGTRPRGKSRQEDEQLEKELLSDEKELAEHNMLVDLGRNDIGKISRIGSVEVEKYMEIERFSHVMHIGSTVKGEILEDKEAIDAVDAILPAGTLSGAPKFRACEIINELENNKRGIYGGAIGYIDFGGNSDTCIAIRLAFSKNGKVFIRSGAGIVADSVPEKEYQECIQKAQAVVKAMEIAREGIDDFTNR